MYRTLIRPVLFLFSPETIHHFTFGMLKFLGAIPGFKYILKSKYVKSDNKLERTLFGLNFPNPVGLAAGFDKDAKLIEELACFGFGFIEIGTLTPKAQPGNDKPRLFRLPKDKAIINRMGFNNEGVIAAVERLKIRDSSGKNKLIIGGNIGKNKITPNENAFDDYKYCIETLYPYVDYFVVNVSSPNTPNLRELQEKDPLKKLMTQVISLSRAQKRPKPILLKIAPDLNESQLTDIVEILLETKTDGVIATNTTITRDGLTTSAEQVIAMGNGGLSGKPLMNRSNEVISFLRSKLGPDFPIIGVGGIMSPQDAIDKLNAGADLVQLYTGFIYEGPGLVSAISKRLLKN
jgi:dihydroorotate dehydrogenase